MKAYFEFYKVSDEGNNDFTVARKIVEKWKDSSIPNFRVAFNKLAELLKELDAE
jgi:hypothetical protein